MSTKTKDKKAKAKHGASPKPATANKAKPMVIPRAPAGSHRPHAGLGRGLDALMSPKTAVASAAKPAVASTPVIPSAQPTVVPPATQAPVSAENAVLSIPIAEITRSPYQSRQIFNEERLQELAESFKVNGIIEPLICRKTKDGKYELINGERRLRAAGLAGLVKAPVVLRQVSDNQAAEMVLIENIQREDLNVIEEAEGYRTLKEKFGLRQEDIADRVGKSRASVANSLRLLDLADEIKQLLLNNLLSMGHAKVLLGLEDVNEQTLLGRKCVTEHLSVRALEALILRRKNEKNGVQRELPKPDLPESYVRDLSDRMHRHFGTSVRITSGSTLPNGKHTKGCLEIDFFDNDELDRILSLLGINPNEN